MNIRAGALAIVTVVGVSITSLAWSMGEDQIPQPQPQRWSSLTTIATGAAIGTINGLLCEATDRFFPLNWILFGYLQDLMHKAVLNDARKAGETVSPALLTDASWISSWLTYLAACTQSLKNSTRTIYYIRL